MSSDATSEDVALAPGSVERSGTDLSLRSDGASPTNSGGSTDSFPLRWAAEARSLLAGKRRSRKRRMLEKFIFYAMGAASLSGQTTVFLCLGDLERYSFPGYHFAFLAQNSHALAFLAATLFGVFFSTTSFIPPEIMSFMFGGYLLASVAFLAIAIAAKGTIFGCVLCLVLVGVMTALTVALIPAVFTVAHAMPRNSWKIAGDGQSMVFGSLPLLAMFLSSFAAGKRLLIPIFALCFLLQGCAVVACEFFRNAEWAADPLSRLQLQAAQEAARNGESETGGATRDRDIESSGEENRLLSGDGDKSSSAKATIKAVWKNLLAVFLPTVVSFALFPSISIGIGGTVSRQFAVTMVATFYVLDMIGRRAQDYFPRDCAVIPLDVLLLFGASRLFYIPFYATMARAGAGNPLAHWATKWFFQASLAFTNGWYAASAFAARNDATLLPADHVKVKFYVGVANALGIPFGTLLMDLMVLVGVFPFY